MYTLIKNFSTVTLFSKMNEKNWNDFYKPLISMNHFVCHIQHMTKFWVYRIPLELVIEAKSNKIIKEILEKQIK